MEHPLYLIKLLTMQRTEYQVDGPLTELARQVLGFGDTAELGKRARGSGKSLALRQRSIPARVRKGPRCP